MISSVKKRIKAGESVIVVNIGGFNPDTLEALKLCGVDLAFIDCERTGLGLDTATELIRAARACGLPSVVRTWSREPEVIVQYLDRKTDGIVVPRIDTAEEARAVVESVKSCCCDDCDNKLIIPQIESTTATANVQKLTKVRGIATFPIAPPDHANDITGKRGADNNEPQQCIGSLCGQLVDKRGRYGLP